MVLELERDPAIAEVLLGEVEVLAVGAKGDVPQARGAPVVATHPEERQPAAFRHEGDRRVTPRGGVLAPEPEDVAVPALGGLLIADTQRDVVQALHTESHVCTLCPGCREPTATPAGVAR